MTTFTRSSVCLLSAALAILLMAIPLVSGNKQDSSQVASKMGFVYKNRWQNHNSNQHTSLPDYNGLNSIDDFSDSSSSSSSSASAMSSFANRQEGGSLNQYACGRPLTNRKPSSMDRDKYQASGVVRTKYRPFEIRMPRIIGGDETDPGEFPWTVSVKLNGQPICGGSLIDESWILTAAHCVVGYNPRNLTVRLGAYRIKDTSEAQTIDSPLSLFIVHKEYSMPRPFSNDIALLKMAEPIRYSDYIIPICLPSSEQDQAVASLLPTMSSNDIVGQEFNSHNSNNKMQLGNGGGGGGGGGSHEYHHSSPTAGSASIASDGIVISTKMSDKEISRCFKRLEQNYLNSIGMGSASANGGNGAGAAAGVSPDFVEEVPIAPTTSAPAAAAAAAMPTGGMNAVAEQQRHHQYSHYQNSVASMPDIELLPTSMSGGVPHAATAAQSSKPRPSAATGGGDTSAMYVASASSYDTPLYSSNQHNRNQQEATNNNDNNDNDNKISFVSDGDLSNGDIQHVDSDYAATSNNGYLQNQQQQAFATITNNQHRENQRNRFAHSSSSSSSYDHHIQHHGGLPLWSQVVQYRSDTDNKNNNNNNNLDLVASSGRVAGLNLNNFYASLDQHNRQAIKLTSLPISKELLREIQSVGSMQSLSLGLQQGDIVALASDLSPAGVDAAAAAAASHSPAEGGLMLAPSLPTGNAAAAVASNNRERVIASGATAAAAAAAAAAGIAGASDSRHTYRNPTRASGADSNELGDGSNELMPGAGDAFAGKYTGLSGIVVGWGWVRENDNDEQVGGTPSSKGFQSVTLQKVRLPILRNSECEAWFRSQEKKITLLPSQFCAGFNLGGKDACRGDSGGPMIIEDNSETGRYKLIGIVSAGIGCARPSLPGLYTRVASFLPWINAQMTRY